MSVHICKLLGQLCDSGLSPMSFLTLRLIHQSHLHNLLTFNVQS